MHETIDEHLNESILHNNDEVAEHNRAHFEELGLFAINIMSAPGAGKTSLLLQTVPALPRCPSVVIEGDMVGELDVNRLRARGIAAHQISTGRSCHLDARMVDRLLHQVELAGGDSDFLFIENVGNLVCPAEFPLGEHKRVVLLSVTEGDDKPLKYPVIFRNCDAVIFTKCDLLPYVDFKLQRATEYIRGIKPDMRIFALSTIDRNGIHEWLGWLEKELQDHRRMVEQNQAGSGGRHVHLGSR